MNKIVFLSFWSVFLVFYEARGDLAYVTDPTGIQVIDTETNTVTATITFPGITQANDIVFSPDQSLAYVAVAAGAPNFVLVMDTQTDIVLATIPIGTNVGILPIESLTPDGRFLYVTNSGSNAVSVIDTASRTAVAAVIVGQFPFGNAITPNGDFVYVANVAGQSVSVIDTSTNAVFATIHLSNFPSQIAITPDGSLAYVTGTHNIGGGGDTNVIDIATNTVIATISSHSLAPDGIVINPAGTLIYVTDEAFGPVNVIERAINQIVATIPIPAVNSAISYNAITFNGKFVYVTTSNGVMVIDTSTNTLIDVISQVQGNGIGMFFVAPAPSPFFPVGQQVKNKFLTQTDIVNGIRWSKPLHFTPVRYAIYRDASQTDLAAIVWAPTTYFLDHNREKKKSYSYFIVAIDSTGATLFLGSVTVAPDSD